MGLRLWVVVVAVAANGETEKEERDDFAGKNIIKYYFFFTIL